MRRGHLGVAVQTVRLPGTGDVVEQKTGLLVTSVESDSPAETGNLLVGDILVSFDDEPVRQPDDLAAFLTGRAGTEIRLRIIRGGVLQEQTVAVGARS